MLHIYSHEKKGFITKLVGVFIENLNENHLEDVLLIVKRQVAEIEYQCDGKSYKQMPSVVSQMRDKVWLLDVQALHLDLCNSAK